MAKILVIRLSAIGDVAMTIPVIYDVARSNPEDSFTVLTQAFLIPVFMNRPPNVEVWGINTKASEKSFRGFWRFTSALIKYDFDKVVDLHNVLRTHIIRWRFRLKGTPVYVLDKNRKARKALTRKNDKELKSLRLVIDRYADVFRVAGLKMTESFISLYENNPADLSGMDTDIGIKSGKWIGIAPFARHRGKTYPIEKMEEVVRQLSLKEDVTLFLFGGRGREEEVLDHWASIYPKVKSVVGRFSLDNELALISKLDILLSMDSANMHFASLVDTRVLSVWGATHPYAGFYGYRQNMQDAIQLDLPCRPCSIYGEKPCYRGDWACMTELSPEMIINKIVKALADENTN